MAGKRWGHFVAGVGWPSPPVTPLCLIKHVVRPGEPEGPAIDELR